MDANVRLALHPPGNAKDHAAIAKALEGVSGQSQKAPGIDRLLAAPVGWRGRGW